VSRIAAIGLVALVLGAAPAHAASGDDDNGREVRVTQRCGPGTKADLRLRRDGSRIDVRLELESRTAGTWRVTLVHERRVVAKASARLRGTRRSFELERNLPDLAGSDTVTAQAWGPRGLTCRVTATLAA
jgi:hypothetical protein